MKAHELYKANQSSDPNQKDMGIGLLAQFGKQGKSQFASLGQFEIKDKKLEEFLTSKIPQSGKSDYELEIELKAKQHQDAKKRIDEELKSLYKIPDHLDVDRMKADKKIVDNTNWISGMMEVEVSQEKRIQNVEQAERLRLSQLKKVFNVDEQPATSTQNSRLPFKKNELHKILDMDRNALRPNREKLKKLEEKREANRKIEQSQNKI